MRSLEKWDIWMHNKKEKTTGVVAYLLYVRIPWIVSAEVRRQIARHILYIGAMLDALT